MTDHGAGARRSASARDRLPGGRFVTIDGARHACIDDVDTMPPFFMSVVSDSDVWAFVGSNGPFTAGRGQADRAMFPYQTVDKILRDVNASGARTSMLVSRAGEPVLWEPWQGRGPATGVRRNLYKRVDGTGVLFEEVHEPLGLRFRWGLSACDRYGLVRRAVIEELAGEPVDIRYLDGWQQIIPPGVDQELYARYSYLAHAYMRHERVDDGPLALYTLNTTITDRPEPTESLRAAVAWSVGHPDPRILLDETGLGTFRGGEEPEDRAEARGRMGAYLALDRVRLADHGTHDWYTVADTGLDHAAVLELRDGLRSSDSIRADLEAAVAADAEGLDARVAAADGIEFSADEATTANHFANVLYNIMRGGTFEHGYEVPGRDVGSYLRDQSPVVLARHRGWVEGLPHRLPLAELEAAAADTDDPQLRRLLEAYLPLTFSRRHGDPSRPWNRFSIRVRDTEGQPVFGYEGNWRDIFQNWEALGQSYPAYLPHFVAVFLNASTDDGYNPYRITRTGIDWEVFDPSDPWSHIGYWGDHQIVYLHRLLEAWERFEPGRIRARLGERSFSSADVPYRIAGFADMARDPRHTITFDEGRHLAAMSAVGELGADAKLVHDADGEVRLVTLAEKLLLPLLVKLTNLVPGSGIWLNTQRPEWNDANNALAGWGVSMVTLNAIAGYLRFLDRVIPDAGQVALSAPVARLLDELRHILATWDGARDDTSRFEMLRRLGAAGEAHRRAVYAGDFGEAVAVDLSAIHSLLATASAISAETVRSSRRPDGLYHGYDLLRIDGEAATIEHLEPMLEGQVSVLASGLLDDGEAVELLDALRSSDLYRADQHSYLLYPDRPSVPFLSRNTLDGPPPIEEPTIFVADRDGAWHFQADLQTVADVETRLEVVGADAATTVAVRDLWRTTFDHASFTGRSGRFFMFEGLGSIYWHMVAKLLLAVQETYQRSTDAASRALLADRYHDIRDGLGFRKTPIVHGAFPTDPYSHTPAHLGAQQPGMTGQVKEQVLTRFGELGLMVRDGCIHVEPRLLPADELATEPGRAIFDGLGAAPVAVELAAHSLAFTFCQLPITLREGEGRRIEVMDQSGERTSIDGSRLDRATSAEILGRTGRLQRVDVTVPHGTLYR